MVGPLPATAPLGVHRHKGYKRDYITRYWPLFMWGQLALVTLSDCCKVGEIEVDHARSGNDVLA